MPRELLKSPETAIGAAVSLLAGLLGSFDVLWQLIASTADLWFPILAVSASTLADAIDWIPKDAAQDALVVGALIYVGILVGRLGESVRERFGGS